MSSLSTYILAKSTSNSQAHCSLQCTALGFSKTVNNNHPDSLLDYGLFGPTSRGANLEGLGLGKRVCISHTFPKDTDAAGSGTTLSGPLLQSRQVFLTLAAHCHHPGNFKICCLGPTFRGSGLIELGPSLGIWTCRSSPGDVEVQTRLRINVLESDNLDANSRTCQLVTWEKLHSFFCCPRAPLIGLPGQELHYSVREPSGWGWHGDLIYMLQWISNKMAADQSPCLWFASICCPAFYLLPYIISAYQDKKSDP